MNARRSFILWAPPLLYIVLIFLVSARSDIRIPDEVSDKSLHFLAYLVLGCLFLRAFLGGSRRPLHMRAGILAVLSTAGYGVLDEFHQSFVPGRYCSGGDVLADLFGAVAGIVVFAAWQRRVLFRDHGSNSSTDGEF